MDEIKAWHFYPIMDKIIPKHIRHQEEVIISELIKEKMSPSLFPDILQSVPVDFVPKNPEKAPPREQTRSVVTVNIMESKAVNSTAPRSARKKTLPLHTWLSSGKETPLVSSTRTVNITPQPAPSPVKPGKSV